MRRNTIAVSVFDQRTKRIKNMNRSVSHLTVYYTMSYYYAAIWYKYMSTVRNITKTL